MINSIQESQQLKVLNEKLNRATELVKKWSLDFEIEVKTERHDDGSRVLSLVAAFRHPSGKIIRTSYPAEDMQDYIDDPISLVNIITDDILEGLFKPTVRESVRAPIDRALNNILATRNKVS